jgi:Domain of unknown function (DUF4349)
MKSLMLIALTACLMAACQPAEVAAPTATPTPPSPSIAPPCEACSTPAAPSQGSHRIVQSANLSLLVDDPVKVLAQIESAAAELGGLTISSSSWSSPGSPSSASLSVRLPPEALLSLRHLATGLASQVQSDNVYSQDVTADYARLQGRQRELAQAEAELVQLVGRPASLQAARSVLVAYQLVTQERTNVEAQIADLDSRLSLASFDLSLNGSVQAIRVE